MTIASYGTSNDPYLERIIKEYRTMSYDVDIVVLSNIPKEVPPGVEVVVGLPTGDPWSLPFAHKQVLADRVDCYDVFIYSENDMLITAANIESFVGATAILREDEIAGFLRVELGPDGRKYYPDVNKFYHWDPHSIVQRGNQVFAFFTCEHAACYMLTRRQLQRAIDSGGFLVGPHQGNYDLACTAATDPYTQCGFKKMVCISDLGKFVVPHLSNKYIGTDYDLEGMDFDQQIEAIMDIDRGARPRAQLLNTETSFPLLELSKSYYEPQRHDVVELVPTTAESILSVGCGWGAMEESLIRRGMRVVGVPLDSVISACAQARGVQTVTPDFESAWKELTSQRFDCVIVSNILHLAPDPPAILKECAKLLSNGGSIILTVPNFNYLKVLWKRIRRMPGYRNLGKHDEAGVKLTTHRVIQGWLKQCGLVRSRLIEVSPRRAEAISRRLRVAAPYLASELIVMCHEKATKAGLVKSQYSESDCRPEAETTAV